MRALIIGSTGATGKDLVEILLRDPDYTEVVAFVRRPGGAAHPKLVEVVTDFDDLEKVSGAIRGDVWFSCLGTTLKAAGSQEKQWRIDHDIPAAFGAIARRNGVARAVLLSAYGAASDSRVFYSRMKGKLEEDLAALAFEQHIVFKPGLLLRPETDRLGERIAAKVLRMVNALGVARRFRPLLTAILAEKLAKAPKVLAPGRHVIELDDIFRL